MLSSIRRLGLALALLSGFAPLGSAGAQTAMRPEPANQLGIELGFLSAQVSYAHRLGDSPVLLGAGAWGAWEPVSSFDRNIFEPMGATVFARLEPAPWVHLDAGPILARYDYADDCSDCEGSFVGLRGGVFFGSRTLYVGPEVAVGSANDDLHGRDTGVIADVRAGVRLRWR
jgi:hypothetical protein